MSLKTNVYNGEVVGYKVCKLSQNKLHFADLNFETYEAAEKYAETVNQVSSKGTVYFAVKITSMQNASVKEPSYD